MCETLYHSSNAGGVNQKVQWTFWEGNPRRGFPLLFWKVSQKLFPSCLLRRGDSRIAPTNCQINYIFRYASVLSFRGAPRRRISCDSLLPLIVIQKTDEIPRYHSEWHCFLDTLLSFTVGAIHESPAMRLGFFFGVLPSLSFRGALRRRISCDSLLPLISIQKTDEIPRYHSEWHCLFDTLPSFSVGAIHESPAMRWGFFFWHSSVFVIQRSVATKNLLWFTFTLNIHPKDGRDSSLTFGMTRSFGHTSVFLQ